MEILATVLQLGIGFIAGWGVVLFLLWIRPEYLFLLFYVIAGFLLLFVLRDVWVLTWSDASDYAIWTARDIAINLAVGAAIVALFKWLKTRKTGRDKQLDREMERIRVEIAARDGQQQ
jgi:hypothetical protein